MSLINSVREVSRQIADFAAWHLLDTCGKMRDKTDELRKTLYRFVIVVRRSIIQSSKISIQQKGGLKAKIKSSVFPV